MNSVNDLINKSTTASIIKKPIQQKTEQRKISNNKQTFEFDSEIQSEREKYMSEYERSLLTIAYKDKIRLVELRQKIKADYFLYLPNKIIFMSLCKLQDDPNIVKPDVDTLVITCEEEYAFSKTGVSPQYIMLVDQGFSDDENFYFYLKRVENAYYKYQLNQTLKNSLSLLDKNSEDLDENLHSRDLVNKVSADLTKLNLEDTAEEQAINLADVAEKYVLDRASGEQEIKGLPTGFRNLDLAINGLLPGTLTVIAGKAKAGKSAFMLNIADNLEVSCDLNKKRTPLLFISTEMSTLEDVSRLIAMRSLVEERRIANGLAYHDPAERKYLEVALDQIKNSQIYHKYLPDFSAEEICSLIHYYKLRYGIQVAIFDYIKMETLYKEENKKKREDQVLGDITDALKRTAGRLNIPIIAGCQINTRNDRVADSDRIVRYCNTLIEFRAKTEEEILAHDPSVYGSHWLFITHSRGGGNRKIPVSFYKPCLKILEAKFHQEEDTEDQNPQDEALEVLNSMVSPRNTIKANNDRFRMQQTVVNDLNSAEQVLKGLETEDSK